MPAPPPGQAIYISKGDQDLGPFTFAELVEQMSQKQLEPTDLAWHQGVSNWMALDQLPEWPTIKEKLKLANKPASTPPTLKGKKAPPMATGPALFEDSASKPELVLKKKGVAKAEPSVTPQAANPQPISDGGGAGIMSKLLVSMAVLFFLAAVGFAGVILYKNWNKLGL